MTTGRLTRQELGWLLAQEARGAAKILRQDVTLLSQPPPADPSALPLILPEIRVETTLNVLDDAIGMLTELESGPGGSKTSSRRGRIDLAALLWEFAPTASISIEPGAGTEVFGEDGELRRMLGVLVSQTNFSGGSHDAASAPVKIRRHADMIRITVNLGPDVSASSDLERRWLSRMATRMGGQLLLEGGTMSLVLPADASNDQSEVADLRKELVQAQQLGEIYARELASAFAAGQPAEVEAPPERSDVAVRRFELLVGFASALNRTFSAIFHGLEETVGAGAAKAQIASGYALSADLARLASCPPAEAPSRVDVPRTARDAIAELDSRAARNEVRLVLEAPTELVVQTSPRAFALLVRSLVDQGIAATPRGGSVAVTVSSENGGVVIAVSDGGPVVPQAAQADLLEHRIDPTSVGRSPGFALLVANTVAGYLGGSVRLSESSSGTARAEARIRSL